MNERFVQDVTFGPHTASALIALGESLGLRCVRVDFADCRDKRGVLARISAAFAFPRWFGGNWDALYDCLNDLEWLAARGHLLVLEHADELRRAAPEDFVTLLDVLEESARAWQKRGVTFRVIIDLD